MAAWPYMQDPVLIADASPGPAYPITVAQAKSKARITHSEDDDDFDDLVRAATHRLSGWDGYLGGVVLLDQTWRVDWSAFPASRRIDLPMTPVQSIDSVVYADASNVDQTLAASRYSLHQDNRGPYLWLDAGDSSWPGTYLDRRDAVRITMRLGYLSPDDVPYEIREAIKVMVAFWYRVRDEATDGRAMTIPDQVSFMLADHRRARFA